MEVEWTSWTRLLAMSDNPEAQLDKFKALARELEADEDEARWDERLKKVARHKPAPEKPADYTARRPKSMRRASPLSIKLTTKR